VFERSRSQLHDPHRSHVRRSLERCRDGIGRRSGRKWEVHLGDEVDVADDVAQVDHDERARSLLRGAPSARGRLTCPSCSGAHRERSVCGSKVSLELGRVVGQRGRRPRGGQHRRGPQRRGGGAVLGISAARGRSPKARPVGPHVGRGEFPVRRRPGADVLLFRGRGSPGGRGDAHGRERRRERHGSHPGSSGHACMGTSAWRSRQYDVCRILRS